MTSAVIWLVLPLLLVHALATHGAWFAGIWIGLTAAAGFAVERLGFGAFAPAGAAAHAACIYLGALLAKGFVERSRFRGRVTPFVPAHGILAAVVALPLQLAAPAATVTHATLETAACAVAAAAFGLAYRLVSRRTQDDRRKLVVLLAALPVPVALAVGAVLLLRPALGH